MLAAKAMAGTSTDGKMNYRDAKAMAAAPADINEFSDSYVVTIDMPGIKPRDIKVELKDDKVLLIKGERKREAVKEGVKLRTERQVGKFRRKFELPENSNSGKISAVFHNGELTITVEKLPPPDRKKPITIITVDNLPSSARKKPTTIQVKINCCTII